ncbi:MAG: ABC transporter substrate-binding protein, partial [Bacteroidota bacterium]
MKYSINSIVFVVLFLFSCQNGYDNKSLSVDSERYGGIFSYNESGTVKSIFPTSAYYQSEIQLISYIAEPLVKMNEDMSLSPCIAESWDVSPNGLEYLFNIREGIYFHDDPCFESSDGRELDAYDVAFSFTKACQDFENNALSHYLRGIIKGANDYFEGRADEVIGIEVISKHEIKFVLENPYSEFIPVISNPALSIYPKEYFETYSGRLTTHLVGTGPFKISNYEDEKILILERNPGYWQTDDEGTSL